MLSIGQALLKRLQARPPAPTVTDPLPPLPSTADLQALFGAARSRRSDDVERLTLALLTIDRDGDQLLRASATGLLHRAEARLWVSLDLAARRSWWRAPWWSGAAVRLLATGNPTTLGLVVASCHPDGYVREAAVARLAELPDDLAVPALALRAADWVSEVRDRARLAIDVQLRAEPVRVVRLAAPIALTLSAKSQGGWFIDRLRAALRAASDDAITSLLTADDGRTRREAYLAALERDALDLPSLVDVAAGDPDLPIRLMCARSAVRAASHEGIYEALRPLLTSGTAVIRADIVDSLARAGDVDAARDALADTHPRVRAVAQTAVRRAGGDPRAVYVELLTGIGAPRDRARVVGAVAGIGDTGRPDDADIVEPFLENPRPRVRAEAVRSLRRLGRANPERLFPLLTDESGRVVKQVAVALRPAAPTLNEPALRHLLAPASPARTRWAAYRLLRERGIYARLSVDLDLVDDANAEFAVRARADISDWLLSVGPTGYQPPAESMAQRLEQQLTAKGGVLGEATTRTLRFHLRP